MDGQAVYQRLTYLLQQRHAIQVKPFISLIEHDQLQCLEIHRQKKALKTVSNQFDALSTRHAQLEHEFELISRLGSPQLQERIRELEASLVTIHAEQADLYKKQAVNTQRVLELLDSTTGLKNDNAQLIKERDAIAENRSVLQLKVQDLIALVGEKEGVINILKDELHLHHLELAQREEELVAQRKRADVLEAENKTLVDRLLTQKQLEALQVNHSNELFASVSNNCAQVGSKMAPSSSKLSTVVSQISLQASVLDFFSFTKKSALPSMPVSSSNFPNDSLVEKPEEAADHYVHCVLPKKIFRRISTPHTLEVNAIAVSREGRMLATASADKTVIVYDSAMGTVQRTLTGLTQSVWSVEFNETGDLILGTCNDGSINIWSIETARVQHTLTGHLGKVMTATFTAQNRVISGSHDRTIKVFDVAKGYCIRNLFTISSCNDLCAMDAEGSMIVSGHMDGRLRFWDTRSGDSIYEMDDVHSGQITSVSLVQSIGGYGTSASYQLLTAGRDDSLCLVDARMYNIIHRFTHPELKIPFNWSRACASPDGRFVAVGGVEGSVFIWDAANLPKSGAEPITRLKDHSTSVAVVVWNPRGDAMYSIERDKCMILWE